MGATVEQLKQRDPGLFVEPVVWLAAQGLGFRALGLNTQLKNKPDQRLSRSWEAQATNGREYIVVGGDDAAA